MPGGAKAEVFDALVKTSTNLNTDPIDQMLHVLNLGISTGLYGLAMTNLMNDVIMGEPVIRTAATGFSVADPDYVNIAVSGHSHWCLLALWPCWNRKPAGHGPGSGAKGVKLVGMTCVGRITQLCRRQRTDIFRPAGNISPEALPATAPSTW
jgi:carbon-monoxide dehydrogenase catalytic subunit